MYIVSGKYKGRKLLAAAGIRPTTAQLRGAIFNMWQQVVEGAKMLDLFAGSGAVGLEALSRGASSVTFIEQDKHVASLLKKNIASLQEESHSTLLNTDVETGLKKLIQRNQTFDLIFADPPYNQGWGLKILSCIDQSPLLSHHGLLLIEDTSFEDPHLQTLQLLSSRTKGHTTLKEYQKLPLLKN